MNWKLETYNYWSDPRVISSLCTKAFTVVSQGRFTSTVKWNCEQLAEDLLEAGLEVDMSTLESVLAVKRIVCYTCNGTGTITNPSIDCGGITYDDWDDWDYEEQEMYRSGAYDISCPTCDGDKVIAMPDAASMPAAAHKVYQAWLREEEQFARMVAAERKYGA